MYFFWNDSLYSFNITFSHLQFIDITTRSSTESTTGDGNVSEKEESVSSVDIAERNRRLAATQVRLHAICTY